MRPTSEYHPGETGAIKCDVLSAYNINRTTGEAYLYIEIEAQIVFRTVRFQSNDSETVQIEYVRMQQL